MHAKEVIPFFEKSRKALGLDYVDLYLIHGPMGCERDENKDSIKFYNGKVTPIVSEKSKISYACS